ncbi:MAG: hypothetical protein WCL49_13160 [bacterium]
MTWPDDALKPLWNKGFSAITAMKNTTKNPVPANAKPQRKPASEMLPCWCAHKARGATASRWDQITLPEVLPWIGGALRCPGDMFPGVGFF